MVRAHREKLINMTQPVVTFNEVWDFLNTGVWSVTDPATGSAWVVSSNNSYKILGTQPNGNETARLVSVSTIACSPGRFINDASLMDRFVIEWEMTVNPAADVDNSLSFFGISDSNTATRATNNIVGFVLASDVIKGIVDSGGAETLTTVTATPGGMQRFRMEIEGNLVAFYVDGIQLGVLTPATISKVMYLNFFLDTEAGGPVALYIGELRWWFDSIPNQNSLKGQIPRIDVKKSTDTPIPIVLVSADDSREIVSEVYWGDISVEYADQDDSGWTPYTHAGSDWTEIGDGLYTLNIGASEFDADNKWVMVRVEDDNASAMSYMIRCDVKKKTFDEHFDDTGGSSGNTYNITNSIKESNKNFRAQDQDIDKILERLKNIMSRTSKIENKLSKIDKGG